MKKIFSIALSAVLAFSMVAPAFAAVAEVCESSQELGQGTSYDDLNEALFAGSSIPDSTVYLTTEDDTHTVNVSTDGPVVVQDTTFDLNGKTLVITGGGEEEGMMGIATANNSTITNGSIKFDENASLTHGISVEQGNLSVEGVDIVSDGTVDAIISVGGGQGISTATITDSSISAESSELFKDSKADISEISINSGSFTGSITEGSYQLGDNHAADKTEEYVKKPSSDDPGTSGPDKAPDRLVVTNDDTAAVVVGNDGTVSTYTDLEKAAEKVGTGAAVNVVNGAAAPEGFVITDDGKLVAKPEAPDPGPGNPNPPVIVPGIEGPGLMDDPTVEIDDPDVPLASLPITLAPTDKLTRGMLMSILHSMGGAPTAELASFIDVDAGSSYAVAIGWASANGIAKGVGGNKFAPEDFVTRGQLVAFLNRYAAYAGSSVTVELDGDADEILSWAVAEEIISGFFAQLYA